MSARCIALLRLRVIIVIAMPGPTNPAAAPMATAIVIGSGARFTSTTIVVITPHETIVEANRLRKGGLGGFFARERFEVVVDADIDPPDAPTALPAEFGLEATEDFCDVIRTDVNRKFGPSTREERPSHRSAWCALTSLPTFASA